MKNDRIERAGRVLAVEAAAIEGMRAKLDGRFGKAVDLLRGASGKVIVSGMGKSGLIARKIAATLASTGTPAFFLHPAEGFHGDIGMVRRGDVVIVLSNSGETEEIVRLRSHIEQFREIVQAAGVGVPVGRRLDFLLQEFAREANTIGSKGGDAPIAHDVVELKSELERIREQVQNIE